MKKVEKAAEFVEFSLDAQNKGVCGKKSSNLCVIVFDTPDAYKTLLERFKSDPVTLTYASDPSIRAMFELSSDGTNAQKTAVIYKPKRSKYMQLSQPLTE